MSPLSQSGTAAEKAAYHLLNGETAEAINVSLDTERYWRVDLNIGWADEMVADLIPEHDTALGIAYALDAVLDCGVYEDGERL
jgi:hypothetical protein